MATYWTLECDSVEYTLEELSISDLVGRFVNQGADEVRFAITKGEDFDAGPDFDGDYIIIRKDRTSEGGGVYSGGSIWFQGTVEDVVARGDGAGEAIEYVARGPWAAMEETPFAQTWKGTVLTTHVFLNRGRRTDEEVTTAVWLAASAGIPVQVGTIDALAVVPMTEVRDMTIGEVIRQQLSLSPEVVAWFDYSLSPPSFNARKASSLSFVNLNWADAKIVSGSLKPRNDLQLSAVALSFETTGEVDGAPVLNISRQIYPPSATGLERRCLHYTFDLQGQRITHVEVALEAEAIQAAVATEADRLTWWREHCPELQDARIVNLAIDAAGVKFYTTQKAPGTVAGTYTVGTGWDAGHALGRGDYVTRTTPGSPSRDQYYQVVAAVNVTGTYDPADHPEEFTYLGTARQEVTWAWLESLGFTNELMPGSGALTHWLEVEPGISGEQIEVTCVATFGVNDADAQLVRLAEQVLTVKLTATNATTGIYTTVSSITSGETEPAGLAQYLYEQAQLLHYEGEIQIVEDEVSCEARPGTRVNIIGGTGIYNSIGAVVQSVTEDVFNGLTTITVGPPGHLGPQDLFERIRAFRRRRIWMNPATQDDGSLQADGALELPKKGPMQNSTNGAEFPKRIVLRGSGVIDIDPADANGKTLEVREMDYCDSGTVKKIMVLASAPYTP